MITLLLSHQWKAFWRSRNAGKSIAVQILIGFFVLYFLGISLVIGFGLKAILTKLFPGQAVIPIFCGFILYYFATDIMLRFVLQELPTLSVQPYLAQNIKRRQLVNFLNWRSLFTILNILPLVLFIPFSITAIGKQFGPLVASGFVVSIISLCIFNHFLVLFIKRKTIINSWWLAGFFVVVASFIVCEYFHVFSLREVSSTVFTSFLSKPWLCAVTIALAVASFINNSNFLFRNLYIEEMVKSSKQKNSSEYTWLNRFGNMGDLIAVDLKLILRNKRPRSLLMLSFFFLSYGFLFYKQKALNAGELGTIVMVALFITGMFMVSFGQFLFAWQSSHFDGLMASNINIKTFIKSKLVLLVAFSAISLLISLGYGFMDWRLIPIEIAAFLFNAGIHTITCAYIATMHYKGVDLNKSATFNYQGTGVVQWVYSLIIFVIGFIIYFPFAFFISAWAGVAALGIAGLISFLLQDWWVEILTKQFILRKHKMLEGFREK